jgi:hypothetical protein
MKSHVLFFALLFSVSTFAQNTENVFVIMTEGLRWQELFSGADSVLLHDSQYTENIQDVTRQFEVLHPNLRKTAVCRYPFLSGLSPLLSHS